MNPKKVIFLDRDGTINRESADYIKSWEEFEFLPGSLEALARLTRKGYTLILITNQSAVGRGFVAQQTLDHTHSHMRAAVAEAGGRIEGVFFCPHRPDENCACRKPKPGLVRQACERYGIDPADSIMIGDSARDILCGRNAGCGMTILVRTGNGLEAEKALADQNAHPDVVTGDLLQAVAIIDDPFYLRKYFR
ncbi:MAG: D-glycero-beta-D-manno-heptose 1,7-bisphosphate 7-phosphatase [Desulfobacteraceae bacterium]|nr:MAG: D-glycero-beta-D-manno-heptose 1,7-bisphosphate 7-phosphatase [Desulfobacteraceae bacterium]